MADSAGAAIAVGALLHLARPSSEIELPSHIGLMPRPGSVVLVSPYVKLATPAQCDLRASPFEFIEPREGIVGSLEYVGCLDTTWTRYHTWSPLQFFLSPMQLALRELRGLRGQRRIDQEAKIAKALHQLESPYVNPSKVQDIAWLREAFPDRTLVSVGSIEMLCAEIKAFVADLSKVRRARLNIIDARRLAFQYRRSGRKVYTTGSSTNVSSLASGATRRTTLPTHETGAFRSSSTSSADM